MASVKMSLGMASFILSSDEGLSLPLRSFLYQRDSGKTNHEKHGSIWFNDIFSFHTQQFLFLARYLCIKVSHLPNT